MKFTRVKNPNKFDLLFHLTTALESKGFSFQVRGADKKTGFSINNFRIKPEIRGYNVGGFTYHMGHNEKPRRTRCLSWNDWVEVNNTVNDVLDGLQVIAKVFTLGGKFMVRDIDGRKGVEDWEHLEYENVGSVMCPVSRVDLYVHESEV